MTKNVYEYHYQEYYEYHGNTVIERIRTHNGNMVFRDWIIFDSVEEADEYFNNSCYA